MAIEAAQLAYMGVVYAIEPEPADIALIQANAEAFGVPNVRPVLGRAPEVLAELPEPDAIFVGGTGRQADHVLHRCLPSALSRRQPGRQRRDPGGPGLGLSDLEELAGGVRVWNLGIARGIEQMERLRFEAVPPTFLLAVNKQDQGDD